MNSTRKDLIALASTMPEAALWTAYIVLKAVENTHDSVDKEHDAQPPDPAPGSNIIDIRDARAAHPQQTRADTIRETYATSAIRPPVSETPGLEQRRIAEGVGRIQDLRRQIKRAEAMGQSTDLAEGLLSTFIQSLALMRHHFDKAQHRDRPSASS